MRFDTFVQILTEGKGKAEKFSRLIIGNRTPIFTRDDFVKPDGTIQMYLSPKDKREEDVDNERIIRRGLRRLNWVAKSAIKKLGDGEISIEKLGDFVRKLLEKYQTQVLGSTVNTALTGYETRVILNLLLPPTKKNPHGKSVFIIPGMDPNATVEDADKPVRVKVPRAPRAPRAPRGIRAPAVEAGESINATGLYNQVMSMMDKMDEFFDPDLKSIILDIVSKGSAPGSVDSTEPESNIAQESVVVEEGVTVRDILKDPRIKGVFDPNIVRQLVKGMINNNELFKDEEGSLRLRAEGDPETYGTRILNKLADVDTAVDETIPDTETQDIQDLDREIEPTDAELDRIEDESEEGISEIKPEDAGSAKRLGYVDTTTKQPIDDETGDEESEEDGKGVEESVKKNKNEAELIWEAWRK